jgi:hypothetical protein
MEVTLLYFEDCPHWRTAEQRLAEAVAQSGRPDVVLRRQEVRTAHEAEQLGLRGSPTVLVDGRDPFPAPDPSPGLACRLYRGGAATEGAPSVEELVAVLSGG